MLGYKLEEGYYLSVYIDINKFANIYNITLRHDQCIALWKVQNEEIKLVRYWELERISSIKQHSLSFFDYNQAIEVINDLLREYGIDYSDIKEVWGTPLIEKGHCTKDLYKEQEYAFHSLVHLYSAIYLNTELFYSSNIIGLTLDGGPDNIIDEEALEKKYYTGCISIKGKMELFPVDSPGRIWSSLKKITNLREGTLMALGTACTCYYKLKYDLADIELQGKESYVCSKELISNLWNQVTNISSNKLVTLESYDNRFTEEENRISIVVKNVDAISRMIICRNIDLILEKTDIKCEDTYIAMAGGFALNCPTNSYIMSKYNFKGFLAPPCVNDSGMALGIGLYMFSKLVPTYKYCFDGAYKGGLAQEADLEKYKEYIQDVSDYNCESCYEDLRKGPIVWCDGNSELGPRALGHRSILALVDDMKSKDALNRIKKRQWWRPVAPIIINEYVNDWFEDSYESKYMLHTFMINECKKKFVPAILHLNGTARVQTLERADNPLLFNLLEKCMEKTGIPMICNTSLNDKGEPIIEKVEEVLNFALRKKIEVVYINGKRIALRNFHLYKEESPSCRDKNIFIYNNEERQKVKERMEELRISKQMMICYFDNIHLLKGIDVFSRNGAMKLKLFHSLVKEKFQADFED